MGEGGKDVHFCCYSGCNVYKWLELEFEDLLLY